MEIGRAHRVTDRLENLGMPTIAVVHGFCLGGGFEIALACKYRIAIDDARFGFPEVMLGLHPGLGGTVRFTRLINPMEAMTLMLTGRTIDARRAKSLGAVDAVTQERHVRNAVKDAVSGKLARAKPGLLSTILSAGPVRSFLATRMRKEAAKAAPCRALSRALCPDRPLGRARRRPPGDAVGGAGVVRPADGDADGAKPDPRVLPARADEEARRRRQRHQARACDRRGRHGRRHRGLVRARRTARDAGRT